MAKLNNKNFTFKNSESGSTVLIVAICLIPVIFGILALSIDMGKAQAGLNKNNDAVDAAAQGVAQYIQQYQIQWAKANPGKPDWQLQIPPQSQLRAFADNMFIQNVAIDQSYATPIPLGGK